MILIIAHSVRTLYRKATSERRRFLFLSTFFGIHDKRFYCALKLFHTNDCIYYLSRRKAEALGKRPFFHMINERPDRQYEIMPRKELARRRRQYQPSRQIENRKCDTGEGKRKKIGRKKKGKTRGKIGC